MELYNFIYISQYLVDTKYKLLPTICAEIYVQKMAVSACIYKGTLYAADGLGTLAWHVFATQ